MPGTTKKDRQAERLQAIRLHCRINTQLKVRGITTPAAKAPPLACKAAGWSGC